MDQIRGTETILLVEDENSLRQLVSDTLREYGYQVLEAPDAEMGLRLAEEFGGPIDLLLTDLLLPLIDGCQLYKRLRLKRAGLKVIYMSGYIDNLILDDVDCGDSPSYLQKPFSAQKLLGRIREFLSEKTELPA